MQHDGGRFARPSDVLDVSIRQDFTPGRVDIHIEPLRRGWPRYRAGIGRFCLGRRRRTRK
jgi:hypothetical protein